MTNREWLNTLSDDEFISWLLESDHHVSQNGKFEQPFPKLQTVSTGYPNPLLKLKNWLKAERIQK